MPDNLPHCPNDQRLSQFATGTLDTTEIEELTEHIQQCPRCLERLDGLHELGESLPEWLSVFQRPMEASVLQEPEFHELKRQLLEFKHPASQEPAEQPPPIAAPMRIGSYEILKVLGNGSSATVFLAQHLTTSHQVALKVLRKRPMSAEASIPSEFRILSSLSHPSIVKAIDWGCWNNEYLFLAMEHIEGPSLAEVMKVAAPDQATSVHIAATIATALHYAHLSGLIHRDLKPANILLDANRVPYLTDFGLAMHAERGWDHCGELAGSRPYMSPEQIRRESHRLDGRTDIWSLGVVLYELLAGQRPFHGRTQEQLEDEILYRDPRPLRQIDDTIPRDLERICLRCLAKSMSDRYTTASDVADELHDWIQCHADFPSGLSRDGGEFDSDACVIPKGLVSFDHYDASFFWSLLPGPRDREGTPACVRFWLRELNSTVSTASFSVAVMYGPSGCGKSSLLKAGILPKLGTNIDAVYIEIAPPETNQEQDSSLRVLRILQKRFPSLSSERSLTDALRLLRHTPMPGRKVVLVLDQFEQYLSIRTDHRQSDLLFALRQCDGVQLQCVLVVRDDFWMAISTFMHQLEIPILEGQNAMPVHRFNLTHGEYVLTQFGRAYGQLPRGELSVAQREFVRKSVVGLSEDESVICLRLALFAYMIKDRPWTAATLRAAGGHEGLGVRFLEDTFHSSRASRNHLRHAAAAANILRALVPPEANSIKSVTRTRRELLVASKHEHRPSDFQEVLRILEFDLKLILPVPTPDPQPNHEAQAYQLSHDYLVPTVRRWLRFHAESSWSGRAHLRLALREANWKLNPEHRQLPSLVELVAILLFTSRRGRRPSQQRMLWQTTLFYGRRTIVGLAFVSVLAYLVIAYQMATWRVAQLFNVQPMSVETEIHSLKSLAPFATRVLRSHVSDQQLDPTKRFRASLAMLELGYSSIDSLLVHALTMHSDEELLNALPALRRHPQSIDRLRSFWTSHESRLATTNSPHRERVILALLLLFLGDTTATEQIISDQNPDLRSEFIRRLAAWIVDDQLARQISGIHRTDMAIAVCSALGLIPSSRLNAQDRTQLVEAMLHMPALSTDAGTQSAASYVLRSWRVADRQVPIQSVAREFTLIRIPAGTLERKTDRQPQQIPVSSFLLADREVSRHLFDLCVSSDDTQHTVSQVDPRVSPTPSHPVNSVNVEDALRFLNRLSEREGLAPYYEQSSAHEWKVRDPHATGYRLPTDVEWEYACRAGTATEYFSGDSVSDLKTYAVFNSSTSLPSGSRPPNRWGLFDMSGNVWEWCIDEHRQASPDTSEYMVNLSSVLIMGGGYDNPAPALRSQNRVSLNASDRFNGVGLRVARNIGPSDR